MEQKTSNNIYLLKGIAILGIIFVHSTQNVQDVSRIVYHISRFGQMGCQVFFMLSGLLMYNSWMKGKNYRAFVWKRIKNMVPLYWFMIIIYVFLNIVFQIIIYDEKFIFSYKWFFSILGNMFFVNAIIPGLEVSVPGGWYLSTTVVFILIFPLIINIIDFLHRKKISTRCIEVLFLIVSFVTQVCVCYIFKWPITQNNSFLYFSFINQMPCLVIGILYNYEKTTAISRTLERGIACLLLSGLLFYAELSISYIICPFLVSLSAKYLLKWLNRVRSAKIDKLLIGFGKVTYEIYMIQGIFVYYIPVAINYICKGRNVYFGGTIHWFIYFGLILLFIYKGGKKIQLVKNVGSMR